jgi:hypothetical protein
MSSIAVVDARQGGLGGGERAEEHREEKAGRLPEQISTGAAASRHAPTRTEKFAKPASRMRRKFPICNPPAPELPYFTGIYRWLTIF